MANKKTVVEKFEAIKAMLNGEVVEGFTTDEAMKFLAERIEITKNKNAKRDGAEPTPKQKERMAENAAIENKVVAVMTAGVAYSASDLVKLIADESVANTQKLTPRLTALVEAKKLTKAVVKGKSVYSLVVAE